MKTLIILISIFSLSFSQEINLNINTDDHDLYDDEFTIFEDGDEILHIDEDFQLYIHEKKIRTSKAERKLLKKYVRLHRDIVKGAVIIGKEAAKLGLKASAVAIGATINALGDLINGDEDRAEARFENLESDIEWDADKIEELGDDLEEMSDELDDIRRKLRRRIPKLKRVYDF